MTKFSRLGTYIAGIVSGCVLTSALWLGAHTVSAQPTQVPATQTTAFKDIPKGHWAASSVQELKKAGVVQPTPDNNFDGDKYVTRYEAAVLLDRFVHYIEKARAPLHPTTADPKTIPNLPQSPAKESQLYLLQNRFIPTNSALVTQPGNLPVRASEFADSVGAVVERISDRAIAPQPQS